MKIIFIYFVKVVVDTAALLIAAPVLVYGLFKGVALQPTSANRPPRLLWGSSPIISLSLMSRATKSIGYDSEVVVNDLYDIFSADLFDHVLIADKSAGMMVSRFVKSFKAFIFLSSAFYRYDIFHYYFDGGIIYQTVFGKLEFFILKSLGKRIVLIPYGGDAFVFDAIDNPTWRHAMMIEYGNLGNKAEQIEKRVRQRTAQADVVVGCLFHYVNLPRWDILPLTCYPVDESAIIPSSPQTTGPIRIAHATNHRGIKGTAFLEHAVEVLSAEGFDIELDIIEKTPHADALKRIMACDIYVDQLVAAYAQAALEGMAAGKVVISPIDDTPAYNMFRTYSYLDECPIVPGNVRNIENVLRELIARRNHWPKIGAQGVEYINSRHSMAANARMWDAIYQKIWWGKDVDLINYYHPLIGKEGSAIKIKLENS